jgi:hypothetical protein
VGLDDLIDVVHRADGDHGRAFADRDDEPLENGRRQVGSPAAVRGEAHASRDVLDRVELVDYPLV